MSGVVVVVTNAAGTVMATAADFNESRPAGFSVNEMQGRRARETAWRKVMEECCHPDIGQAICISGLTLRSVSQALRVAGWKEQAQDVSVGGEA